MIVPKAPQTPCTEMAPTGSSILSTLSKNETENTSKTPARKPTTIAPAGLITFVPAVIATSPARAPLSVKLNRGFL